MAGLRSFGNRHARAAARQGWHFDFRPHRRSREADGHAAIEILAIALKKRVRRDRKENVEVAGRTAIKSGLPFTREPDARALFDSGGNVDGKSAFFLDMAGSGARLAGMANDSAVSVASRARPLNRKETLGGANLAMAATGATGLGLRPRGRADAFALLTDDEGRDTDFGGLAVKRVFQGDLQIVAEIAATVLTPAALGTHEFAEKVVEY